MSLSADTVSFTWQSVGDRSYRKSVVYADVSWGNRQLQHHLIACAPFAGPIALARNESALTTANEADEHVRIFSSSGHLISSFRQRQQGLVTLGWTAAQSLVLVYDYGLVRVYNVHGEEEGEISVANSPGAALSAAEAAEFRVAGDAQVYDDGVVLRQAGTNDYYCLYDINGAMKVRRLRADTATESPPVSLCVVPLARPDASKGKIEALIGTAEGSIVVADASRSVDVNVSFGPFVHLAVSPDGKSIAAFADSGTLYIFDSELKRTRTQFVVKDRNKTMPSKVAWCGSEAVVLLCAKVATVVTLAGASADFVFGGTSALACCTEVDGCRILTDSECVWVQAVARSSQALFGIGTSDAAATLLDACNHYYNGNALADELLREIDARDMARAAATCLDAACHQCETESAALQASLLRAASFGNLFCQSVDADEFGDVCRMLRVVTAVRAPSVGMPVTFAQMKALGAEVFVQRLVHLRKHLLALRIAKWLGLPCEPVLTAWARARIRMAPFDVSDSILESALVAKLKTADIDERVGFADIATTAYQHGRPALAEALLEHEFRAADQVRGLLDMSRHELALDKALLAQDMSLVAACLKSIPAERFFATLRTRPVAAAQFVKHGDILAPPGLSSAVSRDNEDDAVLQFLYEQDDPSVVAHYLVKLLDPEDTTMLRRIQVAFAEGGNKGHFGASACGAELKLREAAAKLEQKHAQLSFAGRGMTQVLVKLLRNGLEDDAKRLKKDFAVSDRQFWHSRVRALVYAQPPMLTALRKLTSGRRAPPIGWMPIAEALIDVGETVEAIRYIRKLSDTPMQIQWLAELGKQEGSMDAFMAAAEVAVAAKDVHALRYLCSVARSHRRVLEYCELNLQNLVK